MTNLGQIIREIQRDAAALSTAELRTEIEISLDVLDAVIGHLQPSGPVPGTWSDDQRDRRRDGSAALTIALYVRELTTRPAPRFAPVGHQPQLAGKRRARRNLSSPGPAHRGR